MSNGLIVNGNSYFQNNVGISGTLTVAGTANFENVVLQYVDLGISGNLTVGNNAIINNNLTVGGTSIFQKTVGISGELFVNNTVKLYDHFRHSLSTFPSSQFE